MKLKHLFYAFAATLLYSTLVFAVGTTTRTVTQVAGSLYSYSYAWTSDGSGDVSGVTINNPRGYIEQAILTPGSTTPSDLYDVTFTLTGIDILNSEGANQSQTTGEIILFDPPIAYDGSSTLALVVANAGDSKTGNVEFFVRVP